MPTPITDRVPAQRLAGLLDSAMDGIITVDESQAIVLYNRAAEQIFGWDAAQVMGRPLDMLLPVRFRASHREQVQRFGATGVTSRRMGGSTVIHGLRASGEEFPVEASISQLETPHGKLYTVILRDVTERVRAQRELADFAAEAGGVREQEKSRIARELHDELAQTLTALKMDTGWLLANLRRDPDAAAEKLTGMLAMLDAAVASTRRIAADLRPLVLDDLGLVPAIEWVAQNFQKRTGVDCSLDIDVELELGEPYATAVFRIVQESLANVGKHAQAQQANVAVRRERDTLHIDVKDDGRGFDPRAARKPNSLGLVGLRERARQVRGTVDIDSAPGRGTHVAVRIPLVEGRETQ